MAKTTAGLLSFVSGFHNFAESPFTELACPIPITAAKGQRHPPDWSGTSAVTRIVPLEQPIIDQWYSAWSQESLFSEPAIRYLGSLIPAEHFMVVVTTNRQGFPRSLVFRLQRTVQAAGHRVRDILAREGQSPSAAASLRQPIHLHPLEGDPVVSRWGNDPCTFAEAINQARYLSRWSRCSVIFAYDGSGVGHA